MYLKADGQPDTCADRIDELKYLKSTKIGKS